MSRSKNLCAKGALTAGLVVAALSPASLALAAKHHRGTGTPPSVSGGSQIVGKGTLPSGLGDGPQIVGKGTLPSGLSGGPQRL